MDETMLIDGVYAVKEKIGEGGMAAVWRATVDLTRFDYTLLYAYTQVGGATHGERRERAEAFRRELDGKPLDLQTVRAILEAHKIPLPPGEVAVKVAKGEADIPRFEAEWRNLVCLNHENVVKVYGGGMYMNRPYYAMELLPGIVEPERLSRDFSLREKIRVLVQAARGLAYLHENGIVHRDVKPDNMVTCEIAPGAFVSKVTDLGIAKDLEASLGLTMTNAIMGTPYYMSPEQIASSRDVDPRADIYSMGASIYRLVTGVAPYHDKTTVYEIIRAVSLGEKPVPAQVHVPALPGAIARIIDTAMAWDRDHRYVSMDQLAEDLETYLGEENPTLLATRSLEEMATIRVQGAAGAGRYHFKTLRAARAGSAAAPAASPEAAGAAERLARAPGAASAGAETAHERDVGTPPGTSPGRTLAASRDPGAGWLLALVGGLAVGVVAVVALGLWIAQLASRETPGDAQEPAASIAAEDAPETANLPVGTGPGEAFDPFGDGDGGPGPGGGEERAPRRTGDADAPAPPPDGGKGTAWMEIPVDAPSAAELASEVEAELAAGETGSGALRAAADEKADAPGAAADEALFTSERADRARETYLAAIRARRSGLRAEESGPAAGVREPTTPEPTPARPTSSENYTALMRKGFLLLQDEQWLAAEGVFRKALQLPGRRRDRVAILGLQAARTREADPPVARRFLESPADRDAPAAFPRGRAARPTEGTGSDFREVPAE
jgi:serine/threonine-protein kinase